MNRRVSPKLVIAFALALVTLVPGIAKADPSAPLQSLTLAQAAERARDASFDVRTAIEAAHVAHADAATARSGLRPQIAISATALDANASQLGMPVAAQAYAAITASLPLLTPALGPTARASAISADAAATDIDAARNDAFFVAIAAYRRAQLTTEIVGARDEAIRDQAAHLNVTGVRVREGKLPRYLLARDRAALALARQSREDAAADRDEAINDLAVTLAFDLAAPPQIVTPLEAAALDGTLEHFLDRALAQSPLVLGAQLRENAARSSLVAARGAYAPIAMLTAQTYNGASSPHLGAAGGQIALVASLPIIDGGTRAAAEERARATVAQAHVILEKARASTERDVRNAWRDVQSARSNLATAQAVAADAAESLRIARVREAAGKGIELEILDALAVAATAREGIVKSLVRFDLAVASLHHASGDLTL